MPVRVVLHLKISHQVSPITYAFGFYEDNRLRQRQPQNKKKKHNVQVPQTKPDKEVKDQIMQKPEQISITSSTKVYTSCTRSLAMFFS